MLKSTARWFLVRFSTQVRAYSDQTLVQVIYGHMHV